MHGYLRASGQLNINMFACSYQSLLHSINQCLFGYAQYTFANQMLTICMAKITATNWGIQKNLFNSAYCILISLRGESERCYGIKKQIEHFCNHLSLCPSIICTLQHNVYIFCAMFVQVYNKNMQHL